ncbi:MAG: MBL fold metallo-hydrolase [Planctomycetota bacterium]|jgi:hydroxyacylglutathione hydrolase
MFFHQFYLGCLSHASYFIGDERSGTAVVVDPQRDIDQYVAMAEERGMRIEHVFLTHFHADFLAGHLELRDRFGARLYIGRAGETEYEAVALADGDRFEFGDVAIEVLETPGHTPESVCLVLYDGLAEGIAPEAVLTGDTLFIGDVGRPDLFGSVGHTPESLGALLYDSLHGKVMRLPDETKVYPAHGAGSMCGKNLSAETVSTIGAQRLTNYALKAPSREEFVALVTADQPEAPKYFALDAQLNKAEHPTLDAQLERAVVPISLARLREISGEVQLLDVRDAEVFAAGHLPGSINIGLDGRFASWCGTVLDPETPIIVIAPLGREREAILRLGRVGFDRAIGYLDGVEEALRSSELAAFPRLDGGDLATHPEALLVDIRQPGEFGTSHIEGAVSIPLGQIERRAEEIPRDREVVLICRTGYRSAIAASLLERAGHERLRDLRGGVLQWVEDGRAIVGEAPSCSAGT